MSTKTNNIANESVAVAMVAAFRRHGEEVMFGQPIPSSVHLVEPQFSIRQIG